MTETKKRCFVVMGFGIKTDYTTGRKLDLNKSYQYLIKPVLEQKGWECVRADEMPNSGMIDLQMYLELLQADVVIADISTTNANAIYELGIRHALRPFTTIVMAEDKFVYPFDLSHIAITRYTHLGDSIDYGEAERFHGVLNGLLDAALNQAPPPNDSPVYTFVSNLIPPSIREQINNIIDTAKEKVDAIAESDTDDSTNKTLSILCSEAEDDLKNKNFLQAKTLFAAALAMGKANKAKLLNNDSYVIQRLALCTFQSDPDSVDALKEALTLLTELNLDHTNDPETVALAGTVEKKLFEKTTGDERDGHLKSSLLLFERGYFLLNNRYNGINLAYTFNCRADTNLYAKNEDKVADMVFANHVRERVLQLCDQDLADLLKRQADEAASATVLSADDLQRQKDYNNEQKFWILANRAEANFGLGNFEAYRDALTQAQNIEHTEAMIQSFQNQISKLQALLTKYGNLLETPWVYRDV